MTSSAPQISGSDARIPDLIRRLTADSSRLVGDEARLARLEVHEAMHHGARGAAWLAVGFGAAVVALTALTVLLTVAFSALTGHTWSGALLTGVLELVVGALLVRRGVARLKEPDSLTLGAARAEVAETARWVRGQVS